jgi:hydrogenase maturation factor HypE
MSTVVEFSMQVKPGQYKEALGKESAFVEAFMKTHPSLKSVMVIGDEARGVLRAIGVYDSAKVAAKVNSERDFADFNAEIAPLLAGSPERVELDLLHTFSR